MGVARFIQTAREKQYKEVKTRNQSGGDADVAPGSGLPWALATFLWAWVAFAVIASGFLPLQDTRGLCCAPESNARDLSLRDCFVLKPETRSR